MNSFIQHVREHNNTITYLEQYEGNITTITNKIIEELHKGGKILIAGNGGSAADACHIACELVSKLAKKRRALPAIALTENVSILTAIPNDSDFAEVFARQVEALGQRPDILIALSTSGNSENILRAIHMANTLGLTTISITGQSGGRMLGKTDYIIQIPSTNTQRIQEAYMFLLHIMCEMIEDEC